MGKKWKRILVERRKQAVVAPEAPAAPEPAEVEVKVEKKAAPKVEKKQAAPKAAKKAPKKTTKK